eukprot:scaffold26054_cov46-Cyclotella_meneghiniana.AAC.1
MSTFSNRVNLGRFDKAAYVGLFKPCKPWKIPASSSGKIYQAHTASKSKAHASISKRVLYVVLDQLDEAIVPTLCQGSGGCRRGVQYQCRCGGGDCRRTQGARVLFLADFGSVDKNMEFLKSLTCDDIDGLIKLVAPKTRIVRVYFAIFCKYYDR